MRCRIWTSSYRRPFVAAERYGGRDEKRYVEQLDDDPHCAESHRPAAYKSAYQFLRPCTITKHQTDTEILLFPFWRLLTIRLLSHDCEDLAIWVTTCHRPSHVNMISCCKFSDQIGRKIRAIHIKFAILSFWRGYKHAGMTSPRADAHWEIWKLQKSWEFDNLNCVKRVSLCIEVRSLVNFGCS